MITLGQVGMICSLIQVFWESQREYYETLAKEVTTPEELHNIKARTITEWLTQEQELLEKYLQVLTVVNSSYNF